MRARIRTIIFLFIVLATACNQGAVKSSEYVSFVFDPVNGYYQEKVIGNVQYKLLYLPPPVAASNAEDKNIETQADLIRLEWRISGINNRNWKEVVYSKPEFKDYNELIRYLSAGIESDFQLEGESAGFTPLALMHFERNYGLTPFLSFHLVFERPEEAENLTFIYRDKIFNTGDVKISISEEVLFNYPDLKN